MKLGRTETIARHQMADMLMFHSYVNFAAWVVSTDRLSKHHYRCAFDSAEYTA